MNISKSKNNYNEKRIIMKKTLCIVVAILLSIECFAAVVSDNDGSAFVTKEEFENLKLDFNKQIDKYNSSIDNKIDGSIANYLKGITLNSQPTNLIKSFEATTGKKQTWMYALPGNGTSTVTNDLIQTVVCELAVKRINNLSTKQSKWEGARDQLSYFITAVLFPSSTWSDRYAWQNYYAMERPSGTSGVGLKDFPTGDINSETTYRNVGLAQYSTYPQNTTLLTHPLDGSGSGWLWQNFGNNKFNLKYYCTSLYPSFNVLWQLHYYKYFPATTYSYYITSSGLTITDLSMPTNTTLESKWGATNSVGTKASSSTDTNLRNYAEMSSSLVKTDDGNNYLDVVWGLDATTKIYGNDEDIIPDLNSTTTDLQVSTDTKYRNQAYQREGLISFETSYPTVTQKVKLRNFKMQEKSLSYFCNNTLSNLASEIVHIGNGAPCYYCPDPDTDNTVRIKLTTTSGTCTCNVRISDKPFDNGAIAAGANEILNTSFSTGAERTFNVTNIGKGNYYIFIKNNTNNNPITIDSFTIQ